MSATAEQILSARTGGRQVLLTGTGTAAIWLALRAAQLPPGSLVALPALLCISPVLAVLWAGHYPVFVDVDERNYHLDPEQLESLLSREPVAAVVAVHLFGIPCPMAGIERLCRSRGVFLIEDCAQALGGEADGQPLGGSGDVAIFSFGHGKTVEIGHGGAVASGNEALMARMARLAATLPAADERRLRRLRTLRRWFYFRIRSLARWYPGAARLTAQFRHFSGYHLYAFDENRKGELQRALEALDENLAARQALAARYREAIRNPRITFPQVGDAPTRLTVRLEGAETVAGELRRRGIPANTLYPPLDGMFRDRARRPSALPVAHRLEGRLLNLWTSEVSPQQIGETIGVLNRV